MWRQEEATKDKGRDTKGARRPHRALPRSCSDVRLLAWSTVRE